jgi:hypothetical protein
MLMVLMMVLIVVVVMVVVVVPTGRALLLGRILVLLVGLLSPPVWGKAVGAVAHPLLLQRDGARRPPFERERDSPPLWQRQRLRHFRV